MIQQDDIIAARTCQMCICACCLWLRSDLIPSLNITSAASVKKWVGAGSWNFLRDSCKFLMEEIMCAQKIILPLNSLEVGNFQP